MTTLRKGPIHFSTSAVRGYRIAVILLLGALSFFSDPLFSEQCPTSWNDAGVAITNPNPPSPPGTPKLTIDGIKQFVDQNNIINVEDLLNSMPRAMRRNYALVETSRSQNPSSINHPRLIIFGSDARFMMSLGSDPDDPKREQVDMAQLDDDTGFWIFRSLKFGTSTPELSADDSECTQCHSSPARPFWGTYPDWPGMFGPRDDRLTTAQSAAFNRLRDTQDTSDRFHALEFLDSFYNQAGRPVSLPGRVYPYTNTIFNMELGAAVADGVYRRLKNNRKYQKLREELLVVGYCQREIRDRRTVLEEIRQTLIRSGANNPDLFDLQNELYKFLRVDPNKAFSLHKLAGEAPDPGWNVSTDSLYGLVELLILNELMEEDTEIRNVLANAPDRRNGFSRGCFDSIEDSLRYKVYQGWTLRNEARQDAREVDFDVDLHRSGQGIFQQVGRPLCQNLVDTVLSKTDVPPSDNNPPDNDQPDDNKPTDDTPDVDLPDDERPNDDPPSAECPKGARFATNGQDLNYCWFENLPVRNGVQPYCNYLNTHQTLGYLFDDSLGGRCPTEARTASNNQGTTFCLYKNLPVPPGAQQQCDGLISQKRIGYLFPRKN